MTWRDWVEQMKDMGETMVTRLRGDRPLTPFFVIDNGEASDAFPLAPDHFQTDEQMKDMVDLLLPLVSQNHAERCAWLLNADVRYLRGNGRVEIPECIILALVDREVEEVWAAPIYRYGDATAIGIWQPWPANKTRSRLLEPVQEAMR